MYRANKSGHYFQPFLIYREKRTTKVYCYPFRCPEHFKEFYATSPSFEHNRGFSGSINPCCDYCANNIHSLHTLLPPLYCFIELRQIQIHCTSFETAVRGSNVVDIDRVRTENNKIPVYSRMDTVYN